MLVYKCDFCGECADTDKLTAEEALNLDGMLFFANKRTKGCICAGCVLVAFDSPPMRRWIDKKGEHQ